MSLLSEIQAGVTEANADIVAVLTSCKGHSHGHSETENMAQFMKQAAKYKSLSTPEGQRQGGEKGKTI